MRNITFVISSDLLFLRPNCKQSTTMRGNVRLSVRSVGSQECKYLDIIVSIIVIKYNRPSMLWSMGQQYMQCRCAFHISCVKPMLGDEIGVESNYMHIETNALMLASWTQNWRKDTLKLMDRISSFLAFCDDKPPSLTIRVCTGKLTIII